MVTSPSVAKLIFTSPTLEHLSDTELLATTRNLVGRSNEILAALLAHLGEVEARGIHRTRACSSLYTYCIYELRLSEDEAFRRVAAARLVRRFPALFEAIASGELHLTGLLMLGPHFTAENLAEVLARAKHRTKKEIARLVRALDPLPDVPARVEPLGPAPARVTVETPTWDKFMQALAPVRELSPRDRPRNWTSSANEVEDVAEGAFSHDAVKAHPATCAAQAASALTAPAGRLQRYKVQFTASEEYVRLLEKARALLSHALPNAPIEEIQLRAMRAFVTQLETRKYGATPRARKPAGGIDRANDSTELGGEGRPEGESDDPRQWGCGPAPKSGGASDGSVASHPRQRGRYIPAAVRRAVFERDGGRCRYVGVFGTRCRENTRVELHHLRPFARGGVHLAENLELRCTAHNTLAAEEDFGQAFVEGKKGPCG